MSPIKLLVAWAFLAVGVVSTPTPDILPRQGPGYQGPYAGATKCTCSNKEQKSRFELLCEGLWGLPDYGTIEPGWNVCYIYYESTRAKAKSKFSDASCQAYFGKGFEGDCVDYPDTPGAENYTPKTPVQKVSKASEKCCDELIAMGLLPVPECCRNLEEAKKPRPPF